MSDLVTNRTGKNSFYNAADLNRVEAAAKRVAELLTAEGYVVTIETKTDWKMVNAFDTRQWCTVSQMGRYLGNVRECQKQFTAVGGVTLPTTMNGLDYIGANNIEKFLEMVPLSVEDMKGAYRQCGTFPCGEV